MPQDWVAESTRAYSRSSYGPGYGYLWWTDFLGNGVAPAVKLPEGSFMAQGAGGQYAIVMPALDLVVVHRIDRDIPYVEPSARDVARLLWLILKAQGYDAGPDVSLAAASGERPTGDALQAKLQDKTLRFGASLPDEFGNWCVAASRAGLPLTQFTRKAATSTPAARSSA